MKACRRLMRASVLLAAASLAVPALADVHAFVEAYSIQGGVGGIWWDSADNLPGVTFDSFLVSSPDYEHPELVAATASGQADLAGWTVHLAVDHGSAAGYPDLHAHAYLLDEFAVTDPGQPALVGTPLSSLSMDVRIQGSLLASGQAGSSLYLWTRWFGETGYQLAADGTLSGGSPLMASTLTPVPGGYRARIEDVWTLNFCAWGCPQYGVPFGFGHDGGLQIRLDGGAVSPGHAGGEFSFSTSFRWSHASPDLRISSQGGFSQPIPEPSRWALLLLGIGWIGVVGLGKGRLRAPLARPGAAGVQRGIRSRGPGRRE